ncbi:MAG: L,D-transpeptidase [Thiotrichales bacterium]|nr:L,D-transpeptidase [Thiotrichales bacterium]
MIQRLHISVADQRLVLYESDKVLFESIVSTAKNGVGELNGSGCTPRGEHIIRAKIGAKQPINTVFVGRRPTGEVYSEQLNAVLPHRDWILTRILWLSGCELGKNRLGNVDTMRRYIYIHGSPDTAVMGQPGSHGCIRMHNRDVMTLFDHIDLGTKVMISETE